MASQRRRTLPQGSRRRAWSGQFDSDGDIAFASRVFFRRMEHMCRGALARRQVIYFM